MEEGLILPFFWSGWTWHWRAENKKKWVNLDKLSCIFLSKIRPIPPMSFRNRSTVEQGDWEKSSLNLFFQGSAAFLASSDPSSLSKTTLKDLFPESYSWVIFLGMITLSVVVEGFLLDLETFKIHLSGCFAHKSGWRILKDHLWASWNLETGKGDGYPPLVKTEEALRPSFKLHFFRSPILLQYK